MLLKAQMLMLSVSAERMHSDELLAFCHESSRFVQERKCTCVEHRNDKMYSGNAGGLEERRSMQERGQREEENRNAVAAKREAGKARRSGERREERRDEKGGEGTREKERVLGPWQ